MDAARTRPATVAPLAAVPGAERDGSLVRAFHERVLEAPDHPAIVYRDAVFSYARFEDATARLAAWLGACGIGRGDRVAVLGGRSPSAICGIHAACWAGAAYVPLNRSQPPARLASLLAQARPSALIVDADSYDQLEALPRNALPGLVMHVSGDLSGAFSSHAPLAEPVAMRMDDTVYVLFTSGTTGDPKGVMLGAENVHAFMDGVNERYHLGREDRVAQFAEYSFDASVFELFLPLRTGATLFILDTADKLAPARFMAEHRINVWQMVPSAAAIMSRLKQLQPGVFRHLRLTLFGGEALPVEIVEEWRRAAPQSVIENIYGPTEVAVNCLVEDCTELIRATPGRNFVSIGVPHPDMLALVVDEKGHFLADGEPGELVLSGPQVSQGYWARPDLTRERFRTLEHPDYGERLFYFTGDQALRDDEGRLHCLGRVDNQVKINGYRIELEEVDSHLRGVCGTQEAITVAWPIRNGVAQGLVAFVGPCEPSEAEIKRALKAALPTYMLPRRVVKRSALPLSAHGKLDRRALFEGLEAEE